MADTARKLLSLLVSVLTQALLALVRSHLMPFMLLSVWHNTLVLKLLIYLFYFVYKYLSWLESWDVVSRNSHCSVLSDVSCCLLSSVLDDEATEATEINWISLCE